MRDWPVVLFIVVILLIIAAWIRWEYRECKKVGHGTAYCIMRSLTD